MNPSVRTLGSLKSKIQIHNRYRNPHQEPAEIQRPPPPIPAFQAGRNRFAPTMVATAHLVAYWRGFGPFESEIPHRPIDWSLHYTPMHALYSQRFGGELPTPLHQEGTQPPRVNGLHHGFLLSVELKRVLPLRLNAKKKHRL